MRKNSHIPCIGEVAIDQHVGARMPPVFQVRFYAGREYYPFAVHVCERMMTRDENPHVISDVLPLMMDMGKQHLKYVSLRRSTDLPDGRRERDAFVEQRFEPISHCPRPQELEWPPLEGGGCDLERQIIHHWRGSAGGLDLRSQSL